MLEGNRLVHSLDITFIDADFNSLVPRASPQVPGSVVLLPGGAPGASGVPAEGAKLGPTKSLPQPSTPTDNPAAASAFDNPLSVDWMTNSEWRDTPAPAETETTFFDPDDDGWETHAGTSQERSRPSYQGMHVTETAKVSLAKVNQCMEDTDENTTSIQEALDEFTDVLDQDKIEYGTIITGCYMLAEQSTKDVN